MAYPLDVGPQNAVLDALFSRDFSGIPTAFEVAAYTAHPDFGGVELDAVGGYARPTVSLDLTDFPAAVDGVKQSIPVTFAAPTDAWSDVAPYYLLLNGTDRWYTGTFAQAIDVEAAGPAFTVQLAIRWNTEGA